MIFYFILLQILCYWGPRTPSSDLGRFPIRWAFVGISVEFPALCVSVIRMNLLAMRARCGHFAFLNPRFVFLCLQSHFGSFGCGSWSCGGWGGFEGGHELRHCLSIALNKCLDLLGMFIGEIFDKFFCRRRVFLHNVVC